MIKRNNNTDKIINNNDSESNNYHVSDISINLPTNSVIDQKTTTITFNIKLSLPIVDSKDYINNNYRVYSNNESNSNDENIINNNFSESNNYDVSEISIDLQTNSIKDQKQHRLHSILNFHWKNWIVKNTVIRMIAHTITMKRITP